MKLAVSSTGESLDSELDRRFGRCSFFVIVDPETMEVSTIQNVSKGATGGAGVQAAEMLAQAEVNTVLTGNVGPNAFNTLSAAEINVFTGARGTVREAIENFEEGNLSPANEPTASGGSGR